jgi:hypothetical protein
MQEDATMTGIQAGGSVFSFDGGAAGTIEFGTADDARNLREMLESRGGQPLAVILGIASDGDADVEGHAFSSSVELTLQLTEDDTSGHAISVRFPTADDAAKFRRNLLLGGALAASVALGSAGALVISSQPASPVDSGMWSAPAYERPAGRGMLEGEDLVLPAAAGAAATEATTLSTDPVTGRPADRGLLQGVDGSDITAPSITGPGGTIPVNGVDE